MAGQTSPAAESVSQADWPGRVVLFGSGETAPSGRGIHRRLVSELEPPIRAAVLEAPSGFQPNTALVASKVADFLKDSLSEFAPQLSVVPARRRDGHFSTNNPEVLAPLLEANYIFLGPGSPTYAAQHLRSTLAMEYLVGRHRRGAELDTSHCYMGKVRMEVLRQMLPPATVILGIDEHTGLIFDFQARQCTIMGPGSVTILTPHSEEVLRHGTTFPFTKLGDYHLPSPMLAVGPPVVRRQQASEKSIVEPPPKVMELIQRREAARQAREWAAADSLRQRIVELGFLIEDTRDGPRWQPIAAKLAK